MQRKEDESKKRIKKVSKLILLGQTSDKIYQAVKELLEEERTGRV